MSNTYIKSANVNLFGNEIFNNTVEFENGLNIISGVNGTGKTEFIKKIKGGVPVILSDGNQGNSNSLKIFAISPKRQVLDKSVENILQTFKTQNKSVKAFESLIDAMQIKSSGFDEYPPFPELFIQVYEYKIDFEGKTKPAAILETRDAFNDVLRSVFPNYSIVADWLPDETDSSKKLKLQVQKYQLDPINHEQLSTGEREVLALILSIYSSRGCEDIVLIDEPEIHLNWNLEKGLFQFLDWFCEEFEKQIIVVTHSRVIFDERYARKTQYFTWKDQKICVGRELPDAEREQIGGEAAQTLRLALSPEERTIIVEDSAHETVVRELAKRCSVPVRIIQAGNRQNVEQLFKYSAGSGWSNVLFLVDGDNQGERFQDTAFIQLDKYCIQNYFLDIGTLAALSGRSEGDVREVVKASLVSLPQDNKSAVLKKLAGITDASNFPFEVLDTVDASRFISSVFSGLGLDGDFRRTAATYISKSQELGKIGQAFSEIASKLQNGTTS